MRAQTLRARPRWRRRPPGLGERPDAAVTPNVLDRAFGAPAPSRKWIADFTYISPMDFGRGRCGKAQDYFSFSGPDGQPIESSQPALDAPNPLCFAGG
jgi:transposase InsO family protein